MNWSKLFQQFIRKNSLSTKNTAEEVVKLAVQEIESAIEKNKTILAQTRNNQEELSQKITAFQHQIKACNLEANRAIQAKQDQKAQQYISQKIQIEKQAKPFKDLLKQINNTTQQLENQIAKLEAQAEETKAKEIILKAKFESAKTQQELSKQLNELDTEHFDLFEQEVTQIEIENKLTDDLLSLEDEFEALESQNQGTKAQQELEAVKKRQHEENEANQYKKINQIFAQNSAQEKALIEEKKKSLEERKDQLLNELKNSQKPDLTTNKDHIIEDFFNSSDNDNQKKIDDFFNN